MSLVNDMLRDLEARRAAPGEWPLRDGLQAVDEAGAARRERTERLRRGLIWLGAVILLGVMVGLMIGRVLNGEPPSLFAPEPVVNAPVVAPAPRVLEVLPQNDGRRLLLQVLLLAQTAEQRPDQRTDQQRRTASDHQLQFCRQHHGSSPQPSPALSVAAIGRHCRGLRRGTDVKASL